MFELMKKHVLRAIDGTKWASRETKREAEAKIDRLHGNFVGTELFFNYTFLQNRYGQVSYTKYFSTKIVVLNFRSKNGSHEFLQQLICFNFFANIVVNFRAITDFVKTLAFV